MSTAPRDVPHDTIDDDRRGAGESMVFDVDAGCRIEIQCGRLFA